MEGKCGRESRKLLLERWTGLPWAPAKEFRGGARGVYVLGTGVTFSLLLGS